jgi:hypothetical protein
VDTGSKSLSILWSTLILLGTELFSTLSSSQIGRDDNIEDGNTESTTSVYPYFAKTSEDFGSRTDKLLYFKST